MLIYRKLTLFFFSSFFSPPLFSTFSTLTIFLTNGTPALWLVASPPADFFNPDWSAIRWGFSEELHPPSPPALLLPPPPLASSSPLPSPSSSPPSSPLNTKWLWNSPNGLLYGFSLPVIDSKKEKRGKKPQWQKSHKHTHHTHTHTHTHTQACTYTHTDTHLTHTERSKCTNSLLECTAHSSCENSTASVILLDLSTSLWKAKVRGSKGGLKRVEAAVFFWRTTCVEDNWLLIVFAPFFSVHSLFDFSRTSVIVLFIFE